MLSIRWGLGKNTIVHVDNYFRSKAEDEWFNDCLVKDMVRDVDKSEVLAPHCIQSPVLGQIPREMLSSGVKALILAYETDAEIWALAGGDNCAKWYLEIAKRKDVTICLENTLYFPSNHFQLRDAWDGEMFDNYLTFREKHRDDDVWELRFQYFERVK